jgi:predicted acyl esterase
MSLFNRILAKTYKYPPAITHDVAVEKDLEIPMPDGAVLLANRYYPHLPGKRPTFVLSSVYYERIKGLQAGPLAEQGLNVLVVSSRGSFGSTGDYSPFL